jgi:hypothetical protein
MFSRKSPAFIVWVGLLPGCLLGSASWAQAGWADPIQKFLDRAGLFQGVRATGQNTLTLQRNYLQGSQQAFEGQRWDTGNFYRQSSLHLEGPIWKEFGFQADLSASGWGQDYTQWVLGYVGHDTAIFYGDLNVNLPGNEFASFSKSLRGYQVDQVLPNKGLLRAFYSQEKGITHNETFAGNNTSGPYFLTFTPIIEGSLSVKVDERVLQLGTDYRVDYQTGELWFEPSNGPPRIIPSTSTISASYQSTGYNAEVGALSGLRAEMPLRRGRGVVGLTVLRQNRPGTGHGDTAAYQEDIYEGSGTTGPFDTNYRPILADGATVTYRGKTQTIAKALVVLVDLQEQREGVDYDSYRQIGRIIFRRAVPPTSLVKIQYYYSLGITVASPDLEIRGLDLSYQVSRNLSLISQFAQSAGGTSGGSGTALSTLLAYSKPNFTMTAEWRHMQPSFSYMNTAGFYNLQSGLNTRMDWRLGRYLSLSNLYSDVKTNNGLSFGYSGYNGYSNYAGYSAYSTPGVAAQQTTTGSTALDVRAQHTSLGLQFQKPGLPMVSWSLDRMANSGGNLGASNYTTNQLQVRHDFGKRLKAQASWQGNRQTYGGSTSTVGTMAASSSSTLSLLSLTWSPSEKLSFSANLNGNRSTGNSAVGTSITPTSSSSTALQFSARWTPSPKLTFNLDRTGSVSNGAVSSGFYGGYSTYTGGGTYTGPIAGSAALPQLWGPASLWSPSTPATTNSPLPMAAGPAPWPAWLYAQQISGGDDTTTASPRYQDVNTTLGITYNPSDKLNLGLNLARRSYLSRGGVGYLADSNQNTRTLFATWRFSPTWSLTSSLGTDNLVFTDPGRGAVSNNMSTVSLNYQPAKRPWGLGLTLNRQSGSSPTYISLGEHQRYLMVPTALTDLSGQVRYRLNDRSNLYCNLGLSDFSSGYSAFKKNTAELGWQANLGRTTQLNFGYRFIKNLAGTPSTPIFTSTQLTGQDYLTNTFALTLTTSFSGGVGGGGTGAGSAGALAGTDFGSMGYTGFGSGFGSSTALATFGGYQLGFGAGSSYAGGGYGTGAGALSGGLAGTYGRGFSSGLTGYGQGLGSYGGYSGSTGGFSTGLGQFRQKQSTSETSAPPALGWGPAQPGQPGAAGPAGPPQPGAPPAGGPAAGALRTRPPSAEEGNWYWQEGLSRWDLGSAGEWW